LVFTAVGVYYGYPTIDARLSYLLFLINESFFYYEFCNDLGKFSIYTVEGSSLKFLNDCS